MSRKVANSHKVVLHFRWRKIMTMVMMIMMTMIIIMRTRIKI